MGDKDSTIFRGSTQNDGITEALEWNRFGQAKVCTRGEAQSARDDGTLEIRISLEPEFQASFANKRFRASSSRCWSCGLAGLALRSI